MPAPACTSKDIRVKDLTQGQVIRFTCLNGGEFEGIVIDRERFKHDKVVIVKVSEDYFKSWDEPISTKKIVKVTAILGDAGVKKGYISDYDARKKLEWYQMPF